MSNIFLKDICPNCDRACAKAFKLRQCVICQQRFHKTCYDRRVTIKGSDAFICYLCKLDLAEQRVEELEKPAAPTAASSNTTTTPPTTTPPPTPTTPAGGLVKNSVD
ncbi:hypothetical protein G6F42_021937 [Rhizopus arrhizus]|nr:hypothetical protein G6F42_021937 [Rhizopus arrhizus]